MPRYPQGVTSFIPAYQAYQPDFTMMGKMLSIRQNQYDQNWKQLNNVYGSLLYADTTHEQSQEVKDQLKNEIDFNLKRVSGLDLSLEQNVAAAQQVFQPFYENTSLMYDMAATKNISSARAKGDSYKNSVDPKYSELYWNEGMDEINYRIQEFKETPYDQIQSSGLAQVNYTPNFNIAKEAMALAKDFGDVKVPSSDGKYDYVLNLSALKHVRSEKDPFTLMRMIKVNVLNTDKTIKQAIAKGCRKYFCVIYDENITVRKIVQNVFKRLMFYGSFFAINNHHF